MSVRICFVGFTINALVRNRINIVSAATFVKSGVEGQVVGQGGDLRFGQLIVIQGNFVDGAVEVSANLGAIIIPADGVGDGGSGVQTAVEIQVEIAADLVKSNRQVIPFSGGRLGGAG